MSSTLNTKKITAEELHNLLEVDYELGKLYYKPRGVSWWDTRYSGKECFTNLSHGYLVGTIYKVKLLKHRVLWCMRYGYWPEEIDHINGDKSDNRITNLREASRVINQRNYPKISTNTSGKTGVHFRKKEGLWVAYIGNGFGNETLGYFKSKEDAIKVREAKEAEYGYNRSSKRV